MSHSAPTRSWFPSGKKKDAEFFAKLHMLQDGLHRTERDNMRSAIARIESKKTRRNRQFIEKEGKDKRKYDELRSSIRTYQINDSNDFHRWKNDRRFEPKNEVTGSWKTSESEENGKTKNVHHSNGQSIGQSLPSPFKDQESGRRRSGQSRHRNTKQRHSSSGIFSLTDSTIARIATNMYDFDSDQSYDFMRNPDHLPSIPRVGHRVSIAHKNRLKAMTTESEFTELPKSTKKEPKGYRKGGAFENKSGETSIGAKESQQRKKYDEGLRFDVNPRDKDVFKNINKDILSTVAPSTPAPPVNSRIADPVFPSVPAILLPEENADTDEECADSMRSTGELNNAMRKFMMAQEDLESLNKELENIAHLNEDLEKSDDLGPTKL